MLPDISSYWLSIPLNTLYSLLICNQKVLVTGQVMGLSNTQRLIMGWSWEGVYGTLSHWEFMGLPVNNK